MVNKEDGRNLGFDPLSALIYMITLGYVGKVLPSQGPIVTEAPLQIFNPGEHYTKSLAPVEAANPTARTHLYKGREPKTG